MVKIIADSTCDLSKELIEQYDIDLIPLYIHLGEEEYQDGVNVTPEDIYQWSEENKSTPKTAASSIEDVINVLNPYVEAGQEVVFFTISSEMSTEYNVVNMAIDELECEDLVTVIDSRNLSTGIGLLVLEAAEMAQQGKTAKEIESVMEALKPYVRSSFVVDTLKYLHRGGRCSATSALVGGIFKVKPKIVVKDGKMDAGKKYRGSLEHVLSEYTKEMEKQLLSARDNHVFITHSGCDESIVAEIKGYLEGLSRFKQIHVTRAGGVISSHCGPGTLGVLFIEKEKQYGPYDSKFDKNRNGIMEAEEKAAENSYIQRLAEIDKGPDDYDEEDDSGEDF